jgi:hypothetical protein
VACGLVAGHDLPLGMISRHHFEWLDSNEVPAPIPIESRLEGVNRRNLKILDAWSGGGWGIFIALNHHIVVGEAVCRRAHRTVRCATGHCLVHQPCHPTVRVLTILTVGALTSCCTGQSSAAPDRCCSLSSAPLTPTLTSPRNVHALFTLL